MMLELLLTGHVPYPGMEKKTDDRDEDPCDRCHEDPCRCDSGERL